MVRKCWVLVILFLFIVQSNVTRAGDNPGRNKLEMEATQYFEEGLYYKAKLAYFQLDSLYGDDILYKYRIGICLLNQRKPECLSFFEKCLADSSVFPHAFYFYLGKAYQINHRFEKSVAYFEQYIDNLPSSDKSEEEIAKREKMAMHEHSASTNGIEMMKHPLDVTIVNIGDKINSAYHDYGPSLTLDGQTLIFTSERKGSDAGPRDDVYGRYDEDIYQAFRQDSGWSKPERLPDNINSEDEEAAISISSDGKTLLLYKHDKTHSFSKPSGNIYYSKKNTLDVWEDPVPFPEPINSKYKETSATYSADGQTLYFTSDRPGGYGGLDIYEVKKKNDGTWGTPVNMGPEINTPYDEESPYILDEGKTLYFCSKGHDTMGGFDIFISQRDSRYDEWQHPENIGYPINTALDDIYFTWTNGGSRIYFSSAGHNPGGEEDIFYVEMNKSKQK